ncbi:hypothetical protein GA0115254_113917 [Streptomyces sp. Ncost-T10-10d]|nr:hypothetical protein GA0115254_113917 [Streptomyces sp. Ncost-T10-10d]
MIRIALRICGRRQRWTDPRVYAGLVGGTLTLAVCCVVEMNVAEPMFPLRLFRNAAFADGNAATLLGAIARGGPQFMLIIWLQGVWLPLHGYDYARTPLWAGSTCCPSPLASSPAGPVSGALSDRWGARPFAVAGCVVMAASFAGLLLLPTEKNWRTLTKLRTNPGRATHLLRALLALTSLEVNR